MILWRSIKLTLSESSPDSEFYAMQHERSQLLNDKDTIQSDYEELLRNFNTLKEDHVRDSAWLSNSLELTLTCCRRKHSLGLPKLRPARPR